jgi:hypothetical protein
MVRIMRPVLVILTDPKVPEMLSERSLKHMTDWKIQDSHDTMMIDLMR